MDVMSFFWSTVSGLWSLVTDPFGFAIAHWPSLVVLVFLGSLPFAWGWWLKFFASPAGRFITACVVVIALTWTLRGRFDEGEMERERAGHAAELAAIRDANEAARKAAQAQADKDAEINRSTLAKALIAAGADAQKSAAEAEQLRAMLRALPAAEANQALPSALLKIIRGSK